MSAISNAKYKQDIFNAITHLKGEEQVSSSPEKILIELKEIVVEELSHSIVGSDFDLNSFKSAWVTRITFVMTELNLANKVRAIICHTARKMQHEEGNRTCQIQTLGVSKSTSNK
ncbi:hypothetical protein G6F46_009292 [Rhizopus delemar]|uniref:Uncharacterized protein n=2 Tax=Rhizopus TaxID=4842 RepID=A0A9P6YR09_9FUNG|nr:hypothetical protein G6F55_012147 [Rhizopus delemar]KAG1538919.1 hypothetical protein G6F51_009469 [Rhizopus arrhizus]KAG1492739.1 hypothetical protein G6F54_009087 [Rhizopus delemar]KAG1494076.1 hypothetical protein G6F52_013177 [Rhizopus delemar]KAG1507130.1 hypothetical protein G6F53_009178 [Rhizopus delemar]